MTLYLSLLLRRFYSNTFLAQHSRTSNISMNSIKLASIMGGSNLLSSILPPPSSLGLNLNGIQEF